MTYRDLHKHLSLMMTDQLDGDIVVGVDGNYFRVDDLRIADGFGDYFYEGEMFFTTDEKIEPKEQE